MGIQASETERSILDWLGLQRDAMLALLQTLVNTDSGSYDKPGVDAVLTTPVREGAVVRVG